MPAEGLRCPFWLETSANLAIGQLAKEYRNEL